MVGCTLCFTCTASLASADLRRHVVATLHLTNCRLPALARCTLEPLGSLLVLWIVSPCTSRDSCSCSTYASSLHTPRAAHTNSHPTVVARGHAVASLGRCRHSVRGHRLGLLRNRRADPASSGLFAPCVVALWREGNSACVRHMRHALTADAAWVPSEGPMG